MRNIKTLVTAKTIKGTTFVGVRGYLNRYNELSNQTFLAGVSYANLLNNDLIKLTSNEVKKKVVSLYTTNDKTLVKKAYNELVTSLKKRTSSEKEKEQLRANNDKTIKLSDAQINAYTQLAKGVKINDESNEVYVFGLMVRKTKLADGVYPVKNSQKKTIVKNAINKISDQRQAKYRMFKVGKADEINLQGVTI
tara:strand:- start:732 stop:1313 length:582 start_codon:yes stop_codon:yes gene_type:complete